MERVGLALAGLVGGCRAMEHLRARIKRVAASDLRVHVCGETGTGKENVARAVHDLSARSSRRFVAINAAGFSDELFSAELFGHARGAYTGAVTAREGFIAEAEGGTLFIDEVADMSLVAQARLLRFLQEREYQRLGETVARRADVRIVSATNEDLSERVRQGRFRKDLFYRLLEETLVVPPLRERAEDVILLAGHFLALHARIRGETPPSLSAEAAASLRRYSWPGNVRELEIEMRRLVVFVGGGTARTSDLSPRIQAAEPGGEVGLRAALQRHEAECLRLALERNDGVQARAAAELGITRQAFFAKMRRLGLRARENGSEAQARSRAGGTMSRRANAMLPDRDQGAPEAAPVSSPDGCHEVV